MLTQNKIMNAESERQFIAWYCFRDETWSWIADRSAPTRASLMPISYVLNLHTHTHRTHTTHTHTPRPLVAGTTSRVCAIATKTSESSALP